MPPAFTPLGLNLPIILLSIFFLISIPLFFVGRWVFRIADALSSKEFAGALTAAVGGVTGFISLFLLITFLAPFNPMYWQDYRVEGTVVSVTNTWEAGDGSVTTTPVVRLDTMDFPVLVTDPRIVSLEGEDVALRCSINWNFRAADTYTCNIAEI